MTDRWTLRLVLTRAQAATPHAPPPPPDPDAANAAPIAWWRGVANASQIIGSSLTAVQWSGGDGLGAWHDLGAPADLIVPAGVSWVEVGFQAATSQFARRDLRVEIRLNGALITLRQSDDQFLGAMVLSVALAAVAGQVISVHVAAYEGSVSLDPLTTFVSLEGYA